MKRSRKPSDKRGVKPATDIVTSEADGASSGGLASTSLRESSLRVGEQWTVNLVFMDNDGFNNVLQFKRGEETMLFAGFEKVMA